jgi:hypothetical protein
MYSILTVVNIVGNLGVGTAAKLVEIVTSSVSHHVCMGLDQILLLMAKLGFIS